MRCRRFTPRALSGEGKNCFLSYNNRIEKVRKTMETVLWALDLCAVVYACFWALKQDGKALDAAAKRSE